MTGANWFFAALARHAREHGDGELLQWDGEGEASDYLYARERELGPRPDGLGVWAQDSTDIAFLLEYDTGTEHRTQGPRRHRRFPRPPDRDRRLRPAPHLPGLRPGMDAAARRPPAETGWDEVESDRL
jgi:hypothetical protein